METITIKKTVLNLNFEIQTSPQGRPIRYSGIKRNGQKAQQWVENAETKKSELKSHWIYSFRFMDEVGGFIDFEFDCYDNFVGVVKH